MRFFRRRFPSIRISMFQREASLTRLENLMKGTAQVIIKLGKVIAGRTEVKYSTDRVWFVSNQRIGMNKKVFIMYF